MAHFPKLSGYVDESVSVTVDGFTLIARVEYDDFGETPWTRDDGVGPVSDWTLRDKRPGERVLSADGRRCRFYDFAEAVKIARRDGWGITNPAPGMTKGQIAQAAAEQDFKRMADWCADRWQYVGVVVSVSRNGIMLDSHAASLWGIESDAGDYLTETADELIDEALKVGRARLAKLISA